MDFKNPYLLFLAVPGFIAVFAANFVSDFPAIRDSQLPFVYFILSVLSVGPPILLGMLWLKTTGTAMALKDLLRNGFFIASTVGFSLLVGLGTGMLHTTDVVSHSLRSVFGRDVIPIYSHDELVRELFSRLSNERFLDGRFSSNPNDPNGILPRDPYDVNNRYARVGLQSLDTQYEGVVVAYHSGSDTPQVYLSPACRIANDGAAEVVQGSGVWLSLASVDFVEIIDNRCSPCATLHEELNGRVGGKYCPYVQTP